MLLTTTAVLALSFILFVLRKFLNKKSKPSKTVNTAAYEAQFKRQLHYLTHTGDKLADEVVSHLKKHPRGVKDFLKLVEEKAETENSEICKQFLSQAFKTPSWLDVKKIEVAQTMYKKYLTAFMLSGTASLIESFTVDDGAQILSLTGKIGCMPHGLRRLYETQQMVTDLLVSPVVGDVLPGSEAHRTLLRVRLLHAWARNFILKQREQQENPDEYWNMKSRGAPVNQLGLLFTASIFCYSQIRGAEILGAVFTDYEKECYWHLWRYAAVILGAEEDILPLTYTEHVKAHDLITQEKRDISEIGIKLTQQSIVAMTKGPVAMNESFFHSLTRICADDEDMCDKLSLLPVDTKSWVLLNLFKLFTIISTAVCTALPFLWKVLMARQANTFLTMQKDMLKERAEYRFENF